MNNKTKLGILLTDAGNGEHIGFIEFDTSGVLVYQIIKAGLHVFAFKPIDKLLVEEWMKEPLYVKHADLRDENKTLPIEILEEEAISCEEFLNSLEKPLTLGMHIVKANKVYVGVSGE